MRPACLMTLVLGALAAGWQARAEAPADTNAVVVLEAGKTFWRYYEVWQSDEIFTETGGVVHVDMTAPVQGKDDRGRPRPDALTDRPYWDPRKGQAGIRPAVRITGAPFPAAGWEKPEFDDSSWSRDVAVQRQAYRAIQSMYLRGKFEVKDTAQVSDLNLSVGFRGGVVVYLNGKELKRAFLPDGAIGTNTLAKEYPKDAYLKTDGELIDQTLWGSSPTYMTLAEAETTVKRDKNQNQSFTNETNVANYRQRLRTLDVKIPASALRKGVNVLAVLIRRAPADLVMYTGAWPRSKYFDASVWYYSLAWNRCDLEDLRLTVTGKADSLVPNIAQPRGAYVRVHVPIHQSLTAGWYADPNEAPGAIRLQGARNGVYSGAIVASSTDSIRDLKAETSDLKGPGGAAIPASAVTIGFAQSTDYGYFGQFDTLTHAVTNNIASTLWRWRYGYRNNAPLTNVCPAPRASAPSP